MASLIGSLLRKGSRKDGEPLNILTFPTHERYESGLTKTGHNFFAFRGENIKDWDSTYAPVPANYTLLPPNMEPPLDVDFDLILSQNKFGQYDFAKYFSNLYQCPLISLEHTLPFPSWPAGVKEGKAGLTGDVNVFISEYNMREWGYQPYQSVVIHHGIDTKVFDDNKSIRGNHLLSVVNDWINRDWCCGFNLWRDIVKNDLPVCVLGSTKGLSQPAKDLNDLVAHYQQSSVFLNTSLISPVPTSMLEAMACGCAVVSTANCMIPEIIHHGVNGLISNNPAQLREFCQLLLDKPSIARKLGNEARRTVLEKFSLDKFISSWNNLFLFTAENVFVKELT